MSEGYTPIKGKCTWWRERPMEQDIFASRLKDDERRITCSCFVEGNVWTYTRGELPTDCPESRHCRYYIRHL